MELPGGIRPSDNQRKSLGFEIADITKEPVRHDVTIDLGELLTACADGTDDAALFPDPVLQTVGSAQFAYKHLFSGKDRRDRTTTKP